MQSHATKLKKDLPITDQEVGSCCTARVLPWPLFSEPPRALLAAANHLMLAYRAQSASFCKFPNQPLLNQIDFPLFLFHYIHTQTYLTIPTHIPLIVTYTYTYTPTPTHLHIPMHKHILQNKHTYIHKCKMTCTNTHPNIPTRTPTHIPSSVCRSGRMRENVCMWMSS